MKGACFIGVLILGVSTSAFGYSSPIENQTTEVVSSTWVISTNLYVGRATGGNGLVITNGGTVATDHYTYMGQDSTADSNTLIIHGAGSSLSCNGTRIGGYGSYNTMRIEAGGQFYSSVNGYYSAVGDEPGSEFNAMMVDGTGSYWDAVYIAIGNESSRNSMLIENGGRVNARASTYIGRRYGAAYNTITIRGANSRMDTAGCLFMGCQPAGNLYIVEHSGGGGEHPFCEQSGGNGH